MDLSLQAVPVNTSPGEEYADNTRMFQGIPGIERAGNGRLWVVWYGGGLGEGPENYVMAVTGIDEGESWSGLKLAIDPPGSVRASDPCLWHDPAGRLWLFWAQGLKGQEEHSAVWAITTDGSASEEPEWSRPRRLCGGIMMNKPTVLSSGEWLLPAAVWGTEGSARVVRSQDKGSTWELLGSASVPRKEDRSADEHMIVERRDGSLWMLVRTTYGVGESTSHDRGKTWTPVEPSPIQHTASRFFLRRLSSGNLSLVKHGPIHERTGRSHLTAFLSDDDGATWPHHLLLDEREGVSYPDGVQSPEGTIYIIYDYQRKGARQILMATFTEQDVREGRCVSGQARLRVQVNQATGQGSG